jgi:hypothetical protein
MGILGNALKDRLKGDRPSAPRAVIAAIVAGTVVGVVTYKALRA